MPLIGTVVIRAGLVLILASICLYASGPRASAWGRRAYLGAAACVLVAATLLQILLQEHRFDVEYVYHYSARGLNPFYLLATFWAGQEGSFLLWAFWIALLGVIVDARCGTLMGHRVMPFYGAILGFLMIILTIKSPFAPAPGPLQSDGMGLQPLLENPWMVIHPPTLFLGFALSAVPFAYCMAALAHGDNESWYRPIWPWALLCFGVLGFGVMLGGYWAYETLGWGGFWGWDPVENGPLVPWLLIGAFVHGVQVQHARGALKRSVYLLGALPFLATLYETFLTRTGILSNFSNHSFSTLGGPANGVILWFMLGAMALAIGLIVARGRAKVGSVSVWARPVSREFALTMSIVIMIACALITGIGMSAPLITQLGVKLGWIAHQSSVQAGYYDKANFPIAVLLGFGMAIGPFLAWESNGAARADVLYKAWALAVLLTISGYLMAEHFLGANIAAPMIILMASSLFALFANGCLLVRRLRPEARRPASLGGIVSHIGVSFLLLGVVFLVSLQKSEDVELVQDHPAKLQTMPYAITYMGMSSGLRDRGNVLRFVVLPNSGKGAAGSGFAIAMPCAIRKQETTPVLLARPAIRHRWWGDLYFALKAGPEQVSPTQLVRFTLTKGKSKFIAGYTYTFRSFQVPPDVAAQVEHGIMPARFPVIAEVDVRAPSGKVTRLEPSNIRDRGDPLGPETSEYRLPKPALGTWWGITFDAMNADSGEASFFVRDTSQAPLTRFTIEVSTRPLIWLVWIGTVLFAVGAVIASRRRMIELEGKLKQQCCDSC